jgi:hypothetical protein
MFCTVKMETMSEDNGYKNQSKPTTHRYLTSITFTSPATTCTSRTSYTTTRTRRCEFSKRRNETRWKRDSGDETLRAVRGGGERGEIVENIN